MIAKADAQLDQFAGVWDIGYRDNRPHANINLIQHLKRNHRLDGSGSHNYKITTEDTEEIISVLLGVLSG